VGHVHHDLLSRLTGEIADEYARLHSAALDDPQRAGHGGEMTWARFLEDWLPPGYAVGTRKYIVPEQGDEAFETDLVVFNRAYPERLHGREEVLVGGVAAAFSVKLTVDAAAIRDAVTRAVALHRATIPRIEAPPRDQVVGSFAVGLLGHSHDWKQPESRPLENVQASLVQLDAELVHHPRESLDFVCVADLNTWWTARMPHLPPEAWNRRATESGEEVPPVCATALMTSDRKRSPAPVAVFLTTLLERLSFTDSALRPLVAGLRATHTHGIASGSLRPWDLREVFGDLWLVDLPASGPHWRDPDWRRFSGKRLRAAPQ
jgi:hypothetical protein